MQSGPGFPPGSYTLRELAAATQDWRCFAERALTFVTRTPIGSGNGAATAALGA